MQTANPLGSSTDEGFLESTEACSLTQTNGLEKTFREWESMYIVDGIGSIIQITTLWIVQLKDLVEMHRTIALSTESVNTTRISEAYIISTFHTLSLSPSLFLWRDRCR